MTFIEIRPFRNGWQRNYGEAVRFLQARLAQFHYMSDYDKANYQVALAFMQRFASDMAGAKITAEQALNTLELPHRDPPDNRLRAVRASNVSRAYAAMDKKDAALEAAESAIWFCPVLKMRWTDLVQKRTWR